MKWVNIYFYLHFWCVGDSRKIVLRKLLPLLRIFTDNKQVYCNKWGPSRKKYIQIYNNAMNITTHYTIQLSKTFLDVEIFDIVGCIGEFPSMFRLKCTVPSKLGWC